jgi:hypothetical protein
MRVQSILAQGHRCRIVHERLAIVVVLLRVVGSLFRLFSSLRRSVSSAHCSQEVLRK